MVGQRSYSKQRNLLNAISSLKRAAGIPNSATHKDGDFNEFPGLFEIFVPDSDSANLMANLLCECHIDSSGHKGETAAEKIQNKDDRQRNAFASVKIEKHEHEYKIILTVPEIYHEPLAEKIGKKAQSLIAPDKNTRLLKTPKSYGIGLW